MFHGGSISANMYADDMVLIIPSIYELQLMVNVCSNELNKLDLCINFNKSVALRIEKSYNKICSNIKAMGNDIKWVTVEKYLGIYIQRAHTIVCNFDKQKGKFFGSANCIFAKLGNLINTPVTLHHVQSIALPTLTYALEILSVTKTHMVSIEHPWSRMFMKLFKTFNLPIVQQCQYYSKLLPIQHIYTLHRMSFLTKIEGSNNIF